ncbi:unnamed protein product [Amoebophrya sp. A25]|nr:unnamed protein product [Amoebophrya sp. A25]|eukprot:GSA25T00003452001.1
MTRANNRTSSSSSRRLSRSLEKEQKRASVLAVVDAQTRELQRRDRLLWHLLSKSMDPRNREVVRHAVREAWNGQDDRDDQADGEVGSSTRQHKNRGSHDAHTRSASSSSCSQSSQQGRDDGHDETESHEGFEVDSLLSESLHAEQTEESCSPRGQEHDKVERDDCRSAKPASLSRHEGRLPDNKKSSQCQDRQHSSRTFGQLFDSILKDEGLFG